MLLKCLTQYVNKFGKLSRGHRTGRDQFSFQSQRRAMPKNVQTTIQLCSLHMVARLCSKSFKLGFSSTWSENFQMYRLGFREAEKPEVKLPAFVGSWRKQGSSKKTSTYASWTMLKTLTMWISTNCGKFLEMGVPDHLTCVVRNCMWVKKQLDMEQLSGSKLGREYKAVYYHPAYLTYMQGMPCKMLGWINHKLESRLLGEIWTASYLGDTTLMAGKLWPT